MKYRVLIQRRAERDLNEYYLWAAKRAPRTAARWHLRFEAEILSLANLPAGCGLAEESGFRGYEIRQLLFGRRPNVYRVLFTIDGNLVRVLRVRRASRRKLTAEELKEIDEDIRRTQ
jgi:plasmid stabilization system protein ParE